MFSPREETLVKVTLVRRESNNRKLPTMKNLWRAKISISVNLINSWSYSNQIDRKRSQEEVSTHATKPIPFTSLELNLGINKIFIRDQEREARKTFQRNDSPKKLI